MSEIRQFTESFRTEILSDDPGRFHSTGRSVSCVQSNVLSSCGLVVVGQESRRGGVAAQCGFLDQRLKFSMAGDLRVIKRVGRARRFMAQAAGISRSSTFAVDLECMEGTDSIRVRWHPATSAKSLIDKCLEIG